MFCGPHLGAWGGLTPLIKTWIPPQKRLKQQVGGVDIRPEEEVPDCHCIIPTLSLPNQYMSTISSVLSPVEYFLLMVCFCPFSPPVACPPGTFKSVQGPGLCLQCPPNSRSASEAATICVCRNGYYRGDADLPDTPCTSE